MEDTCVFFNRSSLYIDERKNRVLTFDLQVPLIQIIQHIRVPYLGATALGLLHLLPLTLAPPSSTCMGSLTLWPFSPQSLSNKAGPLLAPGLNLLHFPFSFNTAAFLTSSPTPHYSVASLL